MTQNTKSAMNPVGTARKSISDGTGNAEKTLSNVLSFEMRGCIQAIRANTELLKYWKAQVLDHKTIAFLDKIEGNCMKLDDICSKIACHSAEKKV